MYKGERFNSISHLLGAVAAAAGTTVLVVIAARQGDAWKIVSFGIYGTSLILLYLFSTLYHSLRHGGKIVFRQLDYLAIYLLIAGTYTPFTLIALGGPWGWSIFGLVWGLALLGMILEVLLSKSRRIIPIVIYLVMGWCMLIALKPLAEAMSITGVCGLLLGGLFYTSGLLFYRLDHKFAHFHGIWHLFVLAGSLCHYVTIYYFMA